MAKRIEMWAQMMDEAEQFLMAGFRSRVGATGDCVQAYRQWYDRRMEDHDRTMQHFVTELRRREAASAG
jgi:hypothetical protein